MVLLLVSKFVTVGWNVNDIKLALAMRGGFHVLFVSFISRCSGCHCPIDQLTVPNATLTGSLLHVWLRSGLATLNVVTKAAALKLMPLDPYTPCKVPYALRSRYLALFHDECVKFCASEEEAIIQVGV
uniref:Elongin A binding-protein 1 domain-containing protein n=1 Tax=Parascaris equorum TaxID=6256 RepID=A0A914S8E6_PAREQ